jgi:hypothetical protein
MARKQDGTPYERGYAQGNLSDQDLKELGHTKESYAKHIEEDYAEELSQINSRHIDFYRGMLQGAKDLLK